MVAHAAVKNNVTLVREGRKRLLGVLARHDADLAQELEPLGEPERDGDYADHEQLLFAEVLKGRELISRLEDRKERDVVEFRDFTARWCGLRGWLAFLTPTSAGVSRRRASRSWLTTRVPQSFNIN